MNIVYTEEDYISTLNKDGKFLVISPFSFCVDKFRKVIAECGFSASLRGNPEDIKDTLYVLSPFVNLKRRFDEGFFVKKTVDHVLNLVSMDGTFEVDVVLCLYTPYEIDRIKEELKNKGIEVGLQ